MTVQQPGQAWWMPPRRKGQINDELAGGLVLVEGFARELVDGRTAEAGHSIVVKAPNIGFKSWLSPENRGVEDVSIVVCDGSIGYLNRSRRHGRRRSSELVGCI